jgi:hypothetical protein
METDLHSQAELLAASAELAVRTADMTRARDLYAGAAELELRALRSVPPSQPRTKGILANSTVALYYKAALFDSSEMLAYEYLTQPDLPEFAREELRQTLQAIWEDRQLRASGKTISAHSIQVAIRGPDIGQGQAPIGLVLDKITGVRSLLYRMTEWLSGYPLRLQGNPPDSIRDLCQPWVSEPQTGSYKFSIRLVRSEQLELIPAQKISSAEISTGFMTLMSVFSPPSYGDSLVPSIEELVPQGDHRQAMLKLIRNLLPDGRRVREIEFWSDKPERNERALLHAGSRSRLDEALRFDMPIGESTEVQGVLRAVHLDRSWLEIVPEDSGRIKCKVSHGVLDDVVGPMLNRHVVARGRWNSGHTQFSLLDIEPDPTLSGQSD